MSGAATSSGGAFARWWLRWRFHLSALLVLLPLALLPGYLQTLAVFSGEAGLGAREIGERAVGPWRVRLAEETLLAPQTQGAAGPVKGFNLALVGPTTDAVKAAYLRVGKPRSLRAAGAIFFGSHYRQTAGLPIPARTSPDAEVWLTLEGWDGSVHQAAIPLREASPVTVDWLRKEGDSR